MQGYKDSTLAALADRANIAQFISFGPDLVQRFSRVHGYPVDHRFRDLEEGVKALLSMSPERSVNIRTFRPHSSESSAFLYGLREAEGVVLELRRLASEQFYTIVNETVDMKGGVGGVVMGGLVEFAPGDTPRCVERPGTASLPRDAAIEFFDRLYGFRPQLEFAASARVEFTIHPFRRGWGHGHTIIWELEETAEKKVEALKQWPNLFSRCLGDKAFGLLVADVLGLPVPKTTVLARDFPPFTFGRPTGIGETWLRLCPREQTPGRFTTLRGWADPFTLMEREDSSHQFLGSILAQEAVEPVHSGALIVQEDGQPIIEGVAGAGDRFMQGCYGPDELPVETIRSVMGLFDEVRKRIGDASLEWVYDGRKTWLIQLHCGATISTSGIIVPGTVNSYRRFDVSDGIEKLRDVISTVHSSDEGITLVGRVGVTSHMAELLRKARIPSTIHLE